METLRGLLAVTVLAATWGSAAEETVSGEAPGGTPAGEVLFSSGPQEYAGRKYYWLAEWKLELTLPPDTAAGDQVQVLFGSKGRDPRTLHFEYAGRKGAIRDVGPEDGYQWIELPLGELAPGSRLVLFGAGRERVAFLAGVRIVGRGSAPRVRAVRVATLSGDAGHTARWSDLPGFQLDDRTRRLWDPSPPRPDWPRAERSARFAGIALTKVQRWLHEAVLPVRDPASGLFRATGPEWNYRDTAADCYPFYVWAAFFTDQRVLDTVMIETLEAEQRLCNHVDRLPVRYNMDAGEKVVTSRDVMIFGASEYAKDGLVPIVELTGPESPWFRRLQGITDDIFRHAPADSPYGKIPSTNIEVNGELLQILPRLYSITGDRKYLDWAHRLADYYLLPGRFVPSRLSDHGCEIIGGLGLLFAVDQTACPEKGRQYRPHLEYLFDEILRRGVNSDGVIIGTLQQTPGPHDDVPLRDGWGYDFVGFLDYDLALGTRRYEAAIRRAMSSLLRPRYEKFNWDHPSRDNVADSVEGGLYLFRWLPVPETAIWADREIATLLVDHTDPDRLWGVHKLEANTVRTVLIHTMLHTRNTVARPWQPDLQLGAAPCGDGLAVYMKSPKPYQGRLQFDIPRHRAFLGLTQDWPRLNAVPEWFAIQPDESFRYHVEDADTGTVRTVTGQLLRQGVPVRLEPDQPLRWIVRPEPPGPGRPAAE